MMGCRPERKGKRKDTPTLHDALMDEREVEAAAQAIARAPPDEWEDATFLDCCRALARVALAAAATVRANDEDSA